MPAIVPVTPQSKRFRNMNPVNYVGESMSKEQLLRVFPTYRGSTESKIDQTQSRNN